MNNILNLKFSIFILFTASLIITGCASKIATFDKVAYEKAVSLKVDSLALMSKAVKPYSVSKHKKLVDDLMIKIEKAYEYAKGRPKNEIITEQWFIMKNKNRNLLGGFLVRWKNKGTLSQALVSGAKSNVSAGFDQIIGLESGLIKKEK